MFSVKNDIVLDPFAGTGTTLVAGLASGRHAVGVEIDPSLTTVALRHLMAARSFANAYIRERISKHIEFVAKRTAEVEPLKYKNVHYGFPVITAQEREILINDVLDVAQESKRVLSVTYDNSPQADLVGKCMSGELVGHSAREVSGKKTKQRRTLPYDATAKQEQLKFQKS
jgi:hypothetical protein